VYSTRNIAAVFTLSILTVIFQVNLSQPVPIEAKEDGGGGDNWSYKSCKAPVKSSPPTNQHPVFLQAGCPSHHPTNSVKSPKGKYHIPWTCLPQAHLGVFQLCLWPLIAPLGRVAKPLISPLMPVSYQFQYMPLLMDEEFNIPQAVQEN